MTNSERSLYYTFIKYQQQHDSLTGLPNRYQLTAYIRDQLNTGNYQSIGLLTIDIDRFKLINQTRGYDIADELLYQVKERLTALFPHEYIVRNSGDEFVVVLKNITNKEELELIATSISEQLNSAIVVYDEKLYIKVTIGGTLCFSGDSAQKSLASMELALSKAKEQGSSYYYNNDLDENVSEFLMIEQELRNALIEKNDIKIYLQPKIDLNSNEIVGMEALARWSYLGGEFKFNPSQFIPVAEKTGLISELGDYIFEESCRLVKAINHNRKKPLQISVNFSVSQFRDPTILERMLKVLKKYQVPANWIQIELTESVLMEKQAIELLHQLRFKGFTIAVDDFGKEYSSLSYLKYLPVDILKIDKSFVQEILEDGSGYELVEVIINFARVLNLEVLAEGIETTTQYNILHSLGCNQGQGYYFGKPMSQSDFTMLVGQ